MFKELPKKPYSKPTPGPWKILDLENGHFQITAKGQTPAYAAGQSAIAVVRNWDTEPPKHQVEGNARLMAAAPDLLEAAKFALGKESNKGEAMDKLKQAIAKAEGT